MGKHRRSSRKHPRLEVEDGEGWNTPDSSSAGSDTDDSDDNYRPGQPNKPLNWSAPKRKRSRRSSETMTVTRRVTRQTTRRQQGEPEAKHMTVDGVCPLTLLPMEIWVMVFVRAMRTEGAVPFLYTLEQVCTAWQTVSQMPVLRHSTVDFKCQQPGLITRWLGSGQISHCRHIDLSGCLQTNIERIVSALSDHCPDLQALNLSHCVLHSTSLQMLAGACRKIMHLDLSFTNAPIKSLRKFLKASTFLKEVRMAGSRIGLSLDALSQCKQLDLLDVRDTTIRAGDVEQMDQTCPALRILRLMDCRSQVSQLVGARQGPGFVNLEELSCSSRDNGQVVTDNLLISLLHKASKLRVLDLGGCSSFNPWSISPLCGPSPFRSLEELVLGRSSIQAHTAWLVLVFLKWGKSLRALDLSGIMSPARKLEEIFRSVGPLSPCHLTRLNLESSSADHACVLTVLDTFRDLQVLDLTRCRGVHRDLRTVHAGPSGLARLRVRLHPDCLSSDTEDYDPDDPDY
ncbi:hypothetical protein ACOMHN_027468 [Nucella lapillus]